MDSAKMKKGGAFVFLFRKELNVWRTLKFSNRGAGRKASPMCPGCVHRGIDNYYIFPDGSRMYFGVIL